jgi:hypothetical protein
MVTVYLYTELVKPKKESLQDIYGIQSYYNYDIIYPA